MTDTTPTRLKRYTRGFGYKRLNHMIEAIERNARGVVAPRLVERTHPSVQVARRFIVKSVASDYLVCRYYDGQAEGSVDVYVAKPALFRGSLASQTIGSLVVTFSGYSEDAQSKTAAASGEDDENWKVTPEWIAEQQIWAINVAAVGGTGVTYENANGVDVPIVWIDDNRDGRVWAVEES